MFCDPVPGILFYAYIYLAALYHRLGEQRRQRT